MFFFSLWKLTQDFGILVEILDPDLGQVFVGLSTKRNLLGGQENSTTKNGNSWEKNNKFW